MIKNFFNKKSVVVCFIFYILITFFIFASSLTNGKESGEQSAFVWSIISSVFNIKGDYEFFIRKALGHFSSFFVLAIFATVVYYRVAELSFKNRRNLYFVVITLLAGALTAVIAEVFQLPIFVSGRSASAVDMLIDFSGYFLGFLVANFIRFIIYRKGKDLPVV
ncbi:MAG: VanZ family protein [Clostridia bacterium]|nr:VanZ family protein [Clostridia bacterium]